MDYEVENMQGWEDFLNTKKSKKEEPQIKKPEADLRVVKRSYDKNGQPKYERYASIWIAKEEGDSYYGYMVVGDTIFTIYKNKKRD